MPVGKYTEERRLGGRGGILAWLTLVLRTETYSTHIWKTRNWKQHERIHVYPGVLQWKILCWKHPELEKTNPGASEWGKRQFYFKIPSCQISALRNIRACCTSFLTWKASSRLEQEEKRKPWCLEKSKIYMPFLLTRVGDILKTYQKMGIRNVSCAFRLYYCITRWQLPFSMTSLLSFRLLRPSLPQPCPTAQ